MSSNLIQQLQSVRSMSIVGMCKNAGKTTMLNWLLAHSGRGRVLGLTSIGRDGESTDVVTGTEKPSIFVPAGTLIATARISVARRRDEGDSREHRHPHAAREVIIMRARSDGYVQLAGPSITTQLKSVSQTFFDLGAEQSIIDGAPRAQVPRRAAGGGGHRPLHRRELPHAHGESHRRHREHLPHHEPAEGADRPRRPGGDAGTVPEGAGRGARHRRADRQHGAAAAARGRAAQKPLVVADPSKVLLSPDTL